MLTLNPLNDSVTVKHPRFIWRGSVQAFLNMTDRAIAQRTNFLERKQKAIRAGLSEFYLTSDDYKYKTWLSAVGLEKQNDIDRYLKNRQAHNAPSDVPRLVRCTKCKRVLSDKISVAFGMGPECRKK